MVISTDSNHLRVPLACSSTLGLDNPKATHCSAKELQIRGQQAKIQQMIHNDWSTYRSLTYSPQKQGFKKAFLRETNGQ